MRRALATLVATAAGLVLLLSFKTHGSAPLTRPAALSPATPDAAGSPPSPGPSPSTSAPSSSAPSSSASPNTGRSSSAPSSPPTAATRTVTGDTVQTAYGPVQVQVSVRGSRITQVQPVQLPQDRRRDIEIDNYAVPQLIQETLSAQSAQIDMVSGATYTSAGYIRSLQSALDQLHG